MSITLSAVYPVSSSNSRKAVDSMVSFGSMRPAGISMTYALTGGRNCSIMMVEGGTLGLLEVRMARIATASTPVSPLVFLSAVSHVLCINYDSRRSFDGG
jgi:hypothetical protein